MDHRLPVVVACPADLHASFYNPVRLDSSREVLVRILVDQHAFLARIVLVLSRVPDRLFFRGGLVRWIPAVVDGVLDPSDPRDAHLPW